MSDLIIGIVIAIVIIGSISYLLYKKQGTQPPLESEEETPETAPPSELSSGELPETAIESPPTTPEAETAAPSLMSEASSLPEEAKSELINAVWYRCENPACNYTQFLDIHHILPEAEGGSNRLDNLIVLCPRCHAAADSHEITAEELQSWILKRPQRFRHDLDWPYK